VPAITDYASLKQAFSDTARRTDLVNLGLIDQFISAAQEAIENDLPDLNFGNGIALQEKSYGPFPIVNGAAPVPTDWLNPKLLYVADGAGSQFTLEFRSISWLYSRYGNRQISDIPAYVARDVWQSNFATPLAFTASANQTTFTLGVSPGTASLVLVSLDGAVLFPGSDFTLVGSTLTLTTAALAGQTLSVQFLVSSNGTQSATAVSGQTSFALTSPSASIILATLDGAVLNAGSDYSVSGGFLTLTDQAFAGQTLTVYYAIGSVFVFGPYPDGDYSIGGTYYAKAPLLSATTPTNWMVLGAPNLLLAACLVEAGRTLKDEAMIARWGGVYQTRLKALVDRDKAERFSAGTMAIELA